MNAWLFSATQIETFIACERKWAWSKLEGLTPPGTESQSLGTKVHAQIEDHIANGTPLNLQTPEGQIALTGAHLWQRDKGYQPEAVFCVQLGDHWIWGMMDLILPGEIPEITDHKTTKSLGYAPTPEELPQKVQAAVYALAAMLLSKKWRVTLRWIYYSTKPPFRVPAFPVVRIVGFHEIEDTLRIVLDAADRMHNLVSRSPRPRALELAPSPAHCQAYNGCAYINLCNLTPADHLIANVTKGVVMSNANAGATQNAFLARLKAEAEAAGAGVNPPPAQPSAPPALPPMPVAPSLPTGAIDPATVPGLPAPAPGHYWAIVNNAYAQLAIPVAAPAPAPPLPTPPLPVVPAFAQSPAAMQAATPQPAAPKRRGRPPKATTMAGGVTPSAEGEESVRDNFIRTGFEFLSALADALQLE